MEPVTVICSAACTVTHVVSVDLPPFQLDTADGGLIAGAILAVWAAGWGIRACIQLLRTSDGDSSTSESDT